MHCLKLCVETIEGCFTLVKDIFDSLNDNSATIAIYIDMAKAFNTVNHYILLKKLEKYRLSTRFINYLQSYKFRKSFPKDCLQLKCF